MATNGVYHLVGYHGTVVTMDGNDWFQRYTGTSATLEDVWGTNANNFYAVGEGGTILHFQGCSVTQMASNTNSRLLGIWGRARNDIYAVGEHGAIVHYDGESWMPMDSGVDYRLRGIWGWSSQYIFAVGDDGVLFFNGSEWSTMSSVETIHLVSVWGSSPCDVFAVSETGAILHYNGNEWSVMVEDVGQRLTAVWGTGPNHVIAVGYWGSTCCDVWNIWQFDGRDWFLTYEGYYGRPVDINGRSTDDVVITGNCGSPVRYDGIDWTYSYEHIGDVHAVFGLSSQEIFVLTDSDGILLYDGESVTRIETGLPRENLTTIWGRDGELFLGGRLGLIEHYDGSTWEEMESGTDEHINAIWGASTDDVFAIGRNHTMLHYDGLSWYPVELPPADNHGAAIWGNSKNEIYALFYSSNSTHRISTLYQYDGHDWTGILYRPETILTKLWGSSPDDIYVGGYSGEVLHFNGFEWSETRLTEQRVDAIWGTARDNVLVATNGQLFHFDGTEWDLAVPTHIGVGESLWGTSSSNIYSASWPLLRFCGPPER